MSRSPCRTAIVLVSIGLLLGACTRTGAEPSSVPSASPSPGAVIASPTPAATAEPSPSAEPATSPSTPESEPPVEPMAEPPGASLAVEGGDPVEGQLGSFTWQNGGSDAPWLDGSPIRVGARERLTLSFADPVAVENWSASRVPPGNRDGTGAIGMGEGSGEPVSFDAPPRGTWSVSVNVRFSENCGSAAYYWLVQVD